MSHPFLSVHIDPVSVQPSLPNTVQILNLSLAVVCDDDSISGLPSDQSNLVLQGWTKNDAG